MSSFWYDLWDFISAAARILIAVWCIVELVKFPQFLNAVQRIGLGLLGGCSVMTITIIFKGRGSPFDNWATALFSVGALMFGAGCVWRHYWHWLANVQQSDPQRFRGKK